MSGFGGPKEKPSGFIRAQPPIVSGDDSLRTKALKAYEAQARLFKPATNPLDRLTGETSGSLEEELSLEDLLDSERKAA